VQGDNGPIITVQRDDGTIYTAYGGIRLDGSDSVTGWRAVSLEEYQDIVNTGAFDV
jgi:hypothetical protein